MFRFVKGLLRAILVVIALVVAIPVLGLAYGFLTTSAPAALDLPAPKAAQQATAAELAAAIPGYKRPEESTFLTYPEWAIVYAAREYAGFVRDNNPSGFPYFGYIGRFWQDYAAMIRASSAYPFNFQNHLMLMVIGVSHTVEHVIQSVYENTIGRITSLFGYPTTPDLYLAAAASDYAAFLDQVPWYQFDYAGKRAGLWATDNDGEFVRPWERKLGFGLSFSIKQTYANMIKSGLSATSDPALLDIHVWANGPVADAIAGEANTAIERDLGPDGAVFVTKRYQVFTDMIPRLIERGMTFTQIGGNDEILVTVLSDGEVVVPDGAVQVFSYALPATPEIVRTGLTASVAQLHTVIPDLINTGAQLEHVYDY
jgi:hypothetical protein